MPRRTLFAITALYLGLVYLALAFPTTPKPRDEHIYYPERFSPTEPRNDTKLYYPEQISSIEQQDEHTKIYHLEKFSPFEKRNEPRPFLHPAQFHDYYKWDASSLCNNIYGKDRLEDCLALSNEDLSYPQWLVLTFSDDVSTDIGQDDEFDNHRRLTADYLWVEDDHRTADCLFDLHLAQPNTGCISVAGSKCEANKGTSKILNSRADPHDKYDNPVFHRYEYTPENIRRFQNASEALVGLRVNSWGGNHQDIASGVYFYDIHQTTVYATRGISIVFGGAQQC